MIFDPAISPDRIVTQAAILSEDRKHRYFLGRDTGVLDGDGMVLFVMLNPSTADATADDPTIRRCMGFAADWGYRRMCVVNLYSYRATDPKELLSAENPSGMPHNGDVIKAVAKRANLIVAAWGANQAVNEQDTYIAFLLRDHALMCLGRTKQGYPRHPLYVRKDVEPELYLAARETTVTPHKQLNRHRPDEGVWGDCQRTVYACLLDRHPSEVPHFMEGGSTTHGGIRTGDEVEEHIQTWLDDEGLTEVRIALEGKDVSVDEVLAWVARWNPNRYWILGGCSSNGVAHVVICEHDQIVWDPALDDSGIHGPQPESELYFASFLNRKLD